MTNKYFRKLAISALVATGLAGMVGCGDSEIYLTSSEKIDVWNNSWPFDPKMTVSRPNGTELRFFCGGSIQSCEKTSDLTFLEVVQMNNGGQRYSVRFDGKGSIELEEEAKSQFSYYLNVVNAEREKARMEKVRKDWADTTSKLMILRHNSPTEEQK